jgi:hypothetical protein
MLSSPPPELLAPENIFGGKHRKWHKWAIRVLRRFACENLANRALLNSTLGSFLGSDGTERGPTLLDFPASAVRAGDIPFLVVHQLQDLRKRFLALAAIEFA